MQRILQHLTASNKNLYSIYRHLTAFNSTTNPARKYNKCTHSNSQQRALPIINIHSQ